MTIEIELSPQIEARLTAAALAQGLPPEEYAGTLLQAALVPVESESGAAEKSRVERFHEMLDALAAGSDKLPWIATEALTRESFYEERS